MRATRLALWLAALLGCASTPPPTPRSVTAPPFDHGAAARELGGLTSALVGEDSEARSRARALGFSLRNAEGARELDGAPARDDTVRAAVVVANEAAAAALLVTSACGNASLIGVAHRGSWRARSRRALVETARPGACFITAARAESFAVIDAARRVILVAWSAERDDGDSARETTFSAFHLGEDGTLSDMTGPVPFGGEDDATAVGREGSWFVDDVLPPPRDVVLELRPTHRGLDGVALTHIERQVWRPRGLRLERVLEASERVRPRGGTLAPPR